jgi:hypothetical protein
MKYCRGLATILVAGGQRKNHVYSLSKGRHKYVPDLDVDHT